jgi:hypothetical protein
MTTESSAVMDSLDNGAAEARAWLATLAGLLSKCEYYRSEINGRRLGSDAALVLNRAELMVFAAEDLARVTTFPDRLEEQQVDAIAKAGAFVSAAHAVETGPSRGRLWSALSTLTGGSRPAVVGPAVRDCLEVAADALEGYFHLFGRRLSMPASGWVDAAEAFVADFRRMVKDMPV